MITSVQLESEGNDLYWQSLFSGSRNRKPKKEPKRDGGRRRLVVGCPCWEFMKNRKLRWWRGGIMWKIILEVIAELIESSCCSWWVLVLSYHGQMDRVWNRERKFFKKKKIEQARIWSIEMGVLLSFIVWLVECCSGEEDQVRTFSDSTFNWNAQIITS